MTGRKILVTGASGFLGRYLVPLLSSAGHDVVAVSRRARPSQADVRWIEADLLDEEQCRRAIGEARAEIAVHLAWFVDHGKFWSAPENFAWTRATLVLLDEFARRGGQRIVAAGTCAEYDWSAGICVEDETPLTPRTTYGACKDATRRLLQAFADSAHLGWAWGRIFYVFGRGEPSARLVPSVISALLDGQPVRCSHGQQFRDFIHAEDAAQAFAHLACATSANDVFNISTGEATPIAAVVNYCVSRIRPDLLPEFGAIPVPPDEPPLLVGDNRRLRRTGWQPRLPWTAGIDRTIDELRCSK